MSATRIRTSNILDHTVKVEDLSDLAPSDGGGLSLDFNGGNVRDDNTITTVAAGSIALTDNTTNFVEVSAGGVVSLNLVGFTSGSIAIATVVTLAGAITSITDKRAWLSVGTGGGGGGGITEADIEEGETPTGDLDGVDVTYTLSFTPNPVTSLIVFLNGIRQNEGASNDYTLSGNTITFSVAPVATDVILADYRK